MFNPRLEACGLGPWARLEADCAFTAASRARLWAALLGRVRRLGRADRGLPVYREAVWPRAGARSVTEIPVAPPPPRRRR